MKHIYSDILDAKKQQRKLLAVLIDPEKITILNIPNFLKKVEKSIVTHIFVGGSTDAEQQMEAVVCEIKKHTNLPVLIFPGNYAQITEKADALLFLSLLSGRNPDYLIGQHVAAIPKLINSNLEIIPTAYLLIDGGTESAVARVSETKPLSQSNIDKILHTVLAGVYQGKKMVYLEAGSGAKQQVHCDIVKKVSENVQIPVIVGGGIRTIAKIQQTFQAGADMIVIGTAFEENESFLETLKVK